TPSQATASQSRAPIDVGSGSVHGRHATKTNAFARMTAAIAGSAPVAWSRELRDGASRPALAASQRRPRIVAAQPAPLAAATRLPRAGSGAVSWTASVPTKKAASPAAKT